MKESVYVCGGGGEGEEKKMKKTKKTPTTPHPTHPPPPQKKKKKKKKKKKIKNKKNTKKKHPLVWDHFVSWSMEEFKEPSCSFYFTRSLDISILSFLLDVYIQTSIGCEIS